MSLARSREYLQAIGIELWVPRSRIAASPGPDCTLEPARQSAASLPSVASSSLPAVPGRIVIGPGAGSTLMLCGKSEEAATALAADIARSLGCEPVWSWLAHNETSEGMPLVLAIEERLFTRVLVFGPGPVAPAEVPAARVIGSAEVIQADSIPVLQESGAARRALWAALSASHWCAERARNT